MFVEKLTKKDLIEFLRENNLKPALAYSKKYMKDYAKANSWNPELVKNMASFTEIHNKTILENYDFSKISEYKTGKDEISFKINGNKFIFNDFDNYNPHVRKLKWSTAPNTDWLKFMYGKFGREYRNAFDQNREKEKAKLLRKTAGDFDTETINCINEMENSKNPKDFGM